MHSAYRWLISVPAWQSTVNVPASDLAANVQRLNATSNNINGTTDTSTTTCISRSWSPTPTTHWQQQLHTYICMYSLTVWLIVETVRYVQYRGNRAAAPAGTADIGANLPMGLAKHTHTHTQSQTQTHKFKHTIESLLAHKHAHTLSNLCLSLFRARALTGAYDDDDVMHIFRYCYWKRKRRKENSQRQQQQQTH